MKSLPVLLLLVLFPNPLPAQPAKTTSPKPTAWTPELMLQVKTISSVQVAPDGLRVAYAVRQAVMDGNKSEYRTHIHVVGADGNGSFQLTQGAKSCDSPQWSPDGQWLAFLSSRAGKRDVWLIQPRGGEARQLTGVSTAVSSFKWSPDSKMIAYTALDGPTPQEEQADKEKNDARVVDENIKLSRLYVVAVGEPGSGKPEVRLLTKANLSVSGSGRGGYDWSPDGKFLAVSHTRTPRPDDWTTADLSLVEVATGTVKPLAKTAAAEFAPLWSPDGRSIAYVASDEPPTWAGSAVVHVLPAEGGSPRKLAETSDRFGRYSELIGWSADGKRLYFTQTRGTRVICNALPLDGPPEPLTHGEGTISGAVHLNGNRTMLGFVRETTGQAAEAYVSRIDKFASTRVSGVNRDLPQLPLGRTEVIRWKAPDGLEIEGLLTYPADYAKGKRYPLLLVIHGGPMGVFLENFTGAASLYPVAVFSAHGYAVLRPNVRGSSGYGHKFRYANYGDWGGKDYQDLMAGVDHVVGLGVADPERLGVMGWSYGGFMTSWVITQTKRFKAASVGAAVTDLTSFTGTADIPSFLPDYFGGEAWDRPEVYRKHSPITHVKGVTTPTLIQHGERDERVPLSQGLEYYNALKRQGCTVKMVVYPRTPHGVEEPKLLLDVMTRNVEWFDRYVRNGR